MSGWLLTGSRPFLVSARIFCVLDPVAAVGLGVGPALQVPLGLPVPVSGVRSVVREPEPNGSVCSLSETAKTCYSKTMKNVTAGRPGQIQTDTRYFNGTWEVKVRVWERNAITLKFGWVVKVSRKFMTEGGAKLFSEGYECGLVRCAF